MRTFATVACLSTVLLTACGMPEQGYYDANGNYIPQTNITHDAQRNMAPNPSANTGDYYADRRNGRYDEPANYKRRGYYDYNGYYVTVDNSAVPVDMFPPRGMCRVWFVERSVENQPAIESCNGIRSRVPVGAYVIYGG